MGTLPSQSCTALGSDSHTTSPTIARMPAQSQSVTNSSHYVSVTQSSSAGAATSSRYLSWTVGGRSHYFCSLPGILKILLVLVVLVMARVGNHGSQLNFGDTDANFTGIGASVFLLATLLEVLTTIVGAILILTAGALSITYHASLLRSQYNYNTYDAHAGMAMGVIAIIAGIVLVVDFILSVRKMKITIG